ncbi:tRNA uridine 5-carboxymethylaminomethyl modification enzyme GidA [Fusobacterium gonidiaformans 3-1-5R]|uniref:tRNA uridine 5-carboxymethylaminomethyl modification enzyme MnmG n=1 Tax=Fusobacterium gonidiaformans 3-1-5R TaxID=469605 RepID=E5BHS5_9FUSO|nr:tRNA uridine-5-carboxymethylaminomethyl(34) synthesis enzyme MnmG [Fusobacterium gonidiaformans]EFS22048.1 tRNA uridine 5-carboxymethylaminomethyl modification enzyme GidA [Fusobacterium gonidiaformans 3-1-5R]
MQEFDVIVVGGGHAGCEAALASARLGLKTAIITLYLDSIAMMSCNPSIGGPGKSNLVTEIDILGGEMGRHTDQFNLQLKHLNESKGPAARVTRGQADKFLYRTNMRLTLEHTENLSILQDCVEKLLVQEDEVYGVKTRLGIEYKAKSVILCTGTFLKGKVVIGDITYSAGRQGESAAEKLSENLRELGLQVERYQTATPPRIDKKSIDFSKLKELHGEKHPRYFSIFTEKKENTIVPTWLTYTNEKTLEKTKEMLQYSPIVSGIIETHGPRHCPSIDRKVLNFPEKTDHQIFLEMESLDSDEIYVNGFTTAMPPFAQDEILHTISGLEQAKIMRYGYAVEYDYMPAFQLYPSLENKKISGLFCAGQINGTSGYEEAAAQGLVAGINAARKILGKNPIFIDRSEAYIGVMIDDLIHKKTPEPYRVLPSRSEYRLHLRFDNAFMRLYDKTKEIGLLTQEKLLLVEKAIQNVKQEVERLKTISISMQEANQFLEKKQCSDFFSKGVKIADVLKKKEITYLDLKELIEIPDYPEFVRNQIETILKYEIFMEREEKQILKFKELEHQFIPKDFDFSSVKGISNIALSGLLEVKPLSIGEAGRISGVTGNDLALLIAHLR